MPTQRDLAIFRGDTNAFRFDLIEADGAPRDLTGSTMALEVESQSLPLQGPTVDVQVPSSGQVQVVFSPIVTGGYPEQGAILVRYRLSETTSSGDQFTRCFGRLLMSDPLP